MGLGSANGYKENENLVDETRTPTLNKEKGKVFFLFFEKF